MGTVLDWIKTPKTKTKEKTRESPKYPFRFETRRGCYVVEIRRTGIKPIYRRFPLGTPETEAIAWGYAQATKLEDEDNKDLLATQQREKAALGQHTLATLIQGLFETPIIEKQEGGKTVRCLQGSTIKLRQTMDDIKVALSAFVRDNQEMANKPFIGSGRLTQKDFKDYTGRLSDAKMSSSTIRKYVQYIMYVINIYGREYKDLPIPDYRIDSGKRLRLPKEENRKARTLSDEEYKRIETVLNYKVGVRIEGLLGKMTGKTPEEIETTINVKFPKHKYRLVDWQWKLLTDLALETGVRLNGLLKMRWRDIDWSMNRYRQAADKTSPERTLPLKYERMMDLKRYRDYIPEHCRHRDHTVFFNSHGINRHGPIDPDAASNFFRLKIAVRAGLVFPPDHPKAGKADFTFHMLRHTAKINMRRKGLNGDEINYMTGTKIPDRYLDHWVPEDLNAIQQKLDPDHRYTVDNPKPFVMGPLDTDGH